MSARVLTMEEQAHERDLVADATYDIWLAALALKRYQTEGRTSNELYTAVADIDSELNTLNRVRDRIAAAAGTAAVHEAIVGRAS